MKVLLLTTSDMRSGRGRELKRLVQSVAANLPTGDGLHHILLLQCCHETERLAVADEIGYPATVLAVEDRLSLSAARNIMLAHAREQKLLPTDAIVAFPDDDCWYPDGLLPRLDDTFETDPHIGLLVARVSLSPTATWRPDAVREASTADVMRRSSSNSIFLRGDIVARIGDFDPSLGLGTACVSGEDTDYALRACFVSRRTVYIDLPIVGHNEADLASRTKYFGGDMVVRSRYALHSPALFYEFARKFAVGAYLVIVRRLDIGAYCKAIVGGMRSFGRETG